MNDKEHAKSLREYEEWIIGCQGKCASCGSRLLKGDIRAYEHRDGAPVKIGNTVERMWIYFHCQGCGYDSALWKVVQTLKEMTT